MSYKKIMECSDGAVKAIDGLRELDEVFVYLYGKHKEKQNEKTSLIILLAKGGKHRYRDYANQKRWCQVFSANHPEAPAVTERTDS